MITIFRIVKSFQLNRRGSHWKRKNMLKIVVCYENINGSIFLVQQFWYFSQEQNFTFMKMITPNWLTFFISLITRLVYEWTKRLQPHCFILNLRNLPTCSLRMPLPIMCILIDLLLRCNTEQEHWWITLFRQVKMMHNGYQFKSFHLRS